MANRLLGVISALPEEFAHLSDQSGQSSEIGGLAFWRGQIAGREAVFVESGAGKVNAGIAATLLLDRFGCRALMLCGVVSAGFFLINAGLVVVDLAKGRRVVKALIGCALPLAFGIGAVVVRRLAM